MRLAQSNKKGYMPMSCWMSVWRWCLRPGRLVLGSERSVPQVLGSEIVGNSMLRQV